MSDSDRDSETSLEAAGDEVSLEQTEPTPGDAQGVPVPSEDAQEGSSQTFKAVDGVYTYPADTDPADNTDRGELSGEIYEGDGGTP